MTLSPPPTLDDIRAAARRIAPHVRRTPLLQDEALDALCGGPVWVKAECLQRGGAFKARGAFNAVCARIERDVRPPGLLAFSSGNHAIAVATAARVFGLPAVIVMPADAPVAKRAETAALGAELVLYDRLTEDREAIGARLAAERGFALIKPFDDPDVIAGQGTIGLELTEELEGRGRRLGRVLVCASGGGLAAGIAVAVNAGPGGVALHPVEPEGHDDIARSLLAGERLVNPPGVRSICDALLVDRMGALPFEIGQARFAPGLTVTDAEARAAMRMAYARLRLVVEPGGAVALAAALRGGLGPADGVTAVILSGGNVDPAAYAAILAEAPDVSGAGPG